MATQILFTTIALAALVGCLLAYTRSSRALELVREHQHSIELALLSVKGERDRLTVAERDTEALRRELRKLSGKFYAAQAEREREDEADEYFNELGDTTRAEIQNRFPVCQNWNDAKQQGPRSDAAKCECLYCLAQRAERARLRGELVPRTVQGQAELARLNAAKP